MIKNITIGADPEVFLKGDSGFVSAEGKFGGTKEEPRKLEREGFSIQEDNVMAEFNIHPAKSAEDLIDNIEYMIDYIKIAAQQFDCIIDTSCSALFPQKELDTEQAQTFGCEPDFNAYSGLENIMPESPNPLLRTCGGHIHIGYDNPDEETSKALVRALDITLGLPSKLRDLDTERRKLYGNAGAYRLKDFGVEYRTLSNFWIFNKQHIQWVWDGVNVAVDIVNSGLLDVLEDSVHYDTIEKVINSGTPFQAENLIKNLSGIIKKETICVE